MRVVLAPDTFKGILSATRVAGALGTGWRRGDRNAAVDEVPMADGGEGTLDALMAVLNGRRRRVRVTGPLGDPVEAELGLADHPAGLLGVVEAARASGLELVPEARRDPLRATSRGTGELILAAAQEGARRVIVCLGGTATNDGGAGLAQALGIRLLDERGDDLPPGGAALRGLATIDATRMERAVRDLEVMAATDVDNPLTGPQGASSVYGPQKGAGPAAVNTLEAGLRHLAAVIHRDLGIDVRLLPGGGAAGGMGAGLMAFLGGRMRPGFDLVADAVGLRERVERAEMVVTGEGQYDRQSERGKAAAGVLRLAREAGRRTALVAGRIEPGVRPPADLVVSLEARAGAPEAMARTRELLEAVGEELASSIRLGVSPSDLGSESPERHVD